MIIIPVEISEQSALYIFSSHLCARVILELFDAQGGLRTLLNVMSTLEIFSNEETLDLLSEDALYSSRQLCRHVAVAFRKYFEAHLCIMSENIRWVKNVEMAVSIVDVGINSLRNSCWCFYHGRFVIVDWYIGLIC